MSTHCASCPTSLKLLSSCPLVPFDDVHIISALAWQYLMVYASLYIYIVLAYFIVQAVRTHRSKYRSTVLLLVIGTFVNELIVKNIIA